MRVFLDAGVITRALRSSDKAVALLADELSSCPDFTYISSPFLQAETICHARRMGLTPEIEFLQDYFDRAESTEDLERILVGAQVLIERELPVSLADALHVSAARLMRADVFVTTETGRKRSSGAALLSIREPRVLTLRAAGSIFSSRSDG